MPATPAMKPGDHEDRDPDARRRDTGEPGCLPVVPDREQVAAEAGRVEHGPEHERGDDQDDERNGELVVDVAAAEVQVPLRELGHALAGEDHEGEPLEGGERAERDGQRGQVHERHERPVHETESGRDDEARQRRDPDVQPVVEELRERHDRDGEDRRHRDVDLAGDDDEGQPQRHEADEDVRRDQVEQVDPREKERRERRAPDADADDRDDEQRLPADDEAEQQAAHEAPSARRACSACRAASTSARRRRSVSCNRRVTSASIVIATTIAAPLKNIFQNSESRSSVKPS